MTFRNRFALAGSAPLAAIAAVLTLIGSTGCVGPAPGCGSLVGCGAPIHGGCALEPGCAIEPGCGCEPACGVGGCSLAGQKWCGGCDCGPARPLINVCEGPACGACDPGCGCEPACGVGGCGDVCGGLCGGCGRCPVAQNVAFGLHSIGAELRRLLSPLGLCCPGGACGGCGGCDGELYWSEWHNDPPACHDPCDDCGNWVGPTAPQAMSHQPHFTPRRVTRLPGDGTTKLR
ncbi:hypothetical protein [Botrimarina sp.]|uniref:hypothetical protein n=1 Tax=Botrimarina sp. TaxID=2795802 RepID=UPI0032F06448